MKSVVLAFCVLCVACSAFAQSADYQFLQLINHIDKNSQFMNLNYPSKPAGQNSPSSFSMTYDQTSINMIPGQTVIITGHLKNKTTSNIPLKFYRTHLHLPDSWTSSICFGTNCFAPRTDSFAVGSGYTLPAGGSDDFTLHLYCPNNVSTTDSVYDYIKFIAESGDPSDTLGTFFTGYFMTDAVDQGNAATTGQPKLVSIYPSPLLMGNSIHARISSPREINFSYDIYDALGRDVGFGVSHQHLLQGDNILEVTELTGLPNGAYTLKFSFGDGSMDSRLFQIMR
ncbi:MAG TPA: hypothetical protein VEW28_01355 [Candidatus Kapabacteria bacterium]|nr:hypothetical protein [Candidatus Kapabacteria bacterium]